VTDPQDGTKVDKVAPKKRRTLTVAGVEEQLRNMSGNAAAVARAFGVSRQAVAKFIKSHPSLQTVAEDARETMLDGAESSLYRAVLNGEAWAVCFILKTIGKQRGYVEHEKPRPKSIDDLQAELDRVLGEIHRRGLANPAVPCPVANPGTAANPS